MTTRPSIEAFTADEIVAGIHRAISEGHVQLVTPLLRRLAFIAPDRAERLHQALRQAATTNREQHR